MRAFYLQVIYNFLWLKKISCVPISSCKIFLTPKLNISSIAPFPWPAAPYVRIIHILDSLASFWRRKNAFLFLYYVGALSHWIHRFWSLILYLIMTLKSAWSTNTGLWMVSSLKWKWYREPTGSTMEQWRVKCFTKKWVDCTSPFGHKAKFCEQSNLCTCHYELLSSKKQNKITEEQLSTVLCLRCVLAEPKTCW